MGTSLNDGARSKATLVLACSSRLSAYFGEYRLLATLWGGGRSPLLPALEGYAVYQGNPTNRTLPFSPHLAHSLTLEVMVTGGEAVGGA